MTDTVTSEVPTVVATVGASPTITSTSPLDSIIQQVKGIVEVVNLIWGLVGLVIGLFVGRKTRPYSPRAQVTNKPKRVLNYGADGTLLIAECKVENKGDVRLILPWSRLKVRQILPVHPLIIEAQQERLPLIMPGEREMWLDTVYNQEFKAKGDEVRIESKEEQSIQHHVLLATDVEVVEIYTAFRNTEDPEGFVWDDTTYYNVRTGEVLGSEDKEAQGGEAPTAVADQED